MVLMRHEGGKCLGRGLLLREAWGTPRQTAGSNVVEVYACATCRQQSSQGGGETAADHTLRGGRYCLL